MTDKIAVIKTGGKQYKVAEGQTIRVEKLDQKEGSKIKFETLMTSLSNGENLELGKPSMGEKVEGEILRELKADKVRVVKYKSKTRYLRNKGHRQNYSEVKILAIK
ncbi:MAG: 50S ribosomal protein L21 [bacterium]